MMRFFRGILLLLGVAAACGNGRPAEPPPPTPHGAVGDACTSEAKMARGTCSADLQCVPAPGGYCTKPCSTGSCGDGASCAATARLGELCAKTCADDQDCRQGYACDPAWKVCMVPGFMSPRLAACGAPALTRRVFATPVQVSGPRSPGDYDIEPSAALTKRGDVAVVFATGSPLLDARSPFYGIATTLVHPDGSVEPPHTLTDAKDTHWDAWMASSRGGQLALVWLGFEGRFAPEKNPEIGLATSDDGANWKVERPADDKATDCQAGKLGCYDKPMVVFAPHPKRPEEEVLYVFYETDDAGLKVVRSEDGGATFERSALVRADGGYGTVVAGSRGVLHLALAHAEGRARAFGDARRQVEYLRSEDSGRTFARFVVSAPGELIPSLYGNRAVAEDEARGFLYVAYPSGTPDGRWDVMLATSRDSGATWARIKVNDDAPCANHANPSIAVDPTTGRVHIVWIENRSGAGGVAHASCDPGGTRCSPNDAVNDAPFASYVLTAHSPRWMGEYNALVVDDARRALHAVWTQPVLEHGTPVARIFYARATLGGD